MFFSPRVVSQLKSGFGEADTESWRAQRILQKELGYTKSSITLVFDSETLTVTDPRYMAHMERVLSQVRSLPQVSHIDTFATSAVSSMVSDDGHTTYATIFLKLSLDEAMDLYPDLKDKLLGQGPPGGETTPLESLTCPVDVRVWATGGVPIFSELNEASEQDLRRAEVISFPLVLVALVLVFGGLVAAGVPVAMGAVSISLALAALYFLAQVTDVSIFALNIVSFLGLGVTVDYSLLVVNRYREELELRPKEQAVAYAVAMVGRTLLFSGMTSIMGLSGLLVFKLMMLRSIGLGGMVVIAISLLVALTLLPAILSLLGPRVNSLSLLPRARGGGGMWRKLAFWVMAHPLSLVGSCAFAGIFGAAGDSFLRREAGSSLGIHPASRCPGPPRLGGSCQRDRGRGAFAYPGGGSHAGGEPGSTR